jgi:hypothetical protein
MREERREERKETDRQMKETDRRMKETDRQMKETDRQMKETDRLVKETSRQMGLLNNRFGQLVEHLVAPNIMEKFNERGFAFTQIFQNGKIKDIDNPDTQAEIDILLENGDIVIAVEVKSKPNVEDVNKHIKHMETLRRQADKHSDKRKYQGAIAGAIMDKSIRIYAAKKGFYTIEQTGDTVRITTPKDFKPREW